MRKLRKKNGRNPFFQTLPCLRIWARVQKPLPDQPGWVNKDIRTIMMAQTCGFASLVSCFYYLKEGAIYIIRGGCSQIVVSKLMLSGLQVVCRTTLNGSFSGIAGRNAEYLAPERPFESWNFSAGPGYLEANDIMVINWGATVVKKNEAQWLNRQWVQISHLLTNSRS